MDAAKPDPTQEIVAPQSVNQELVEVIDLAESLFPIEHFGHKLADYRLIKAENLFAATGRKCVGSHCWRLTYKRRGLIPEGPNEMIGKGGEIFINVNLRDHSAEVGGFGE